MADRRAATQRSPDAGDDTALRVRLRQLATRGQGMAHRPFAILLDRLRQLMDQHPDTPAGCPAAGRTLLTPMSGAYRAYMPESVRFNEQGLVNLGGGPG